MRYNKNNNNNKKKYAKSIRMMEYSCLLFCLSSFVLISGHSLCYRLPHTHTHFNYGFEFSSNLLRCCCFFHSNCYCPLSESSILLISQIYCGPLNRPTLKPINFSHTNIHKPNLLVYYDCNGSTFIIILLCRNHQFVIVRKLNALMIANDK